MRPLRAPLAALALGAGLCCSRAPRPEPSVAPLPVAVAPGPLFVYECDVAGNLDICTVPAGGGQERRLAEHPAEDLYPRWTRDGAAVLFSSERSGSWQIWEWVEGSSPRRKRESPAREWQSDPHPNGRQLAFLAEIGGQESLRAAASGGCGAGRVLLTHGKRVVLGNPHWSPDGTRVVFSSNRGHSGHHVYLLDVASGKERRVSALMSGACEPRFSPDGERVAYVRRQHLSPERSQIVEHDLGSGKLRVLVDWPALNYDPAWSPDGSELAFVSDIAGGGVQAIYRLRLADGQCWRVTFRYPARHPDYRPS